MCFIRVVRESYPDIFPLLRGGFEAIKKPRRRTQRCRLLRRRCCPTLVLKKALASFSPISILCRFRKRQGLIFPLPFSKTVLSALSPFCYVSVVFAKAGHHTPNPTVLEAVPNKTRNF